MVSASFELQRRPREETFVPNVGDYDGRSGDGATAGDYRYRRELDDP